MITHTRSERPQFGGASHDWSCRCKNCGVRMIRAWNSVDICRKKRGRFQLQRFEYVDTRASVAWFILSSHNQSWPFNVVTLHFFFVHSFLTWFAFLSLSLALSPSQTSSYAMHEVNWHAKERNKHTLWTMAKERRKKNTMKKMVSKHELRASLFHSPLIYSNGFDPIQLIIDDVYQISIDRW